MFRQSLLAGIIIGLGGVGLLYLDGIVSICALILCFICLIYSDGILYTGAMMKLGKEITWFDFIKILVGNVLGVYTVSLLSRWSGIDIKIPQSILTSHLSIPLGKVFTRGLLCGVVFGISVSLHKTWIKVVPIIFAAVFLISSLQFHSILELSCIFVSRMISWKIVLFWFLIALGNFIGYFLGSLFIPDKKRENSY